jgi:glycosyltransferase involved in cell wall biosynthesis
MNDSTFPLISIVIPTYNRADLIGKAIQSILDQTYNNWELIVVDNYSDDDTREVIDSFNDDRIVILSRPRTGSVAASRNLGVANSNGEWIAFLDSDDWWFPKKLESASERFQKEPGLIYHDLQIVAPDGSPINRKKTKSRKLNAPFYLDLLLNGNDIALSSVIVRKEIFLKVNGMNESASFYAVEDYDTWLRIAQVTNKFEYINTILGAYRLHDGNIGKINNFEYLSNALKDHLSLLKPDQLRRYQSLYVYQIARAFFREGSMKSTVSPFIFVLRFGKAQYRFKAALMLISNVIRHFIIPKKEDFNSEKLLTDLLGNKSENSSK